MKKHWVLMVAAAFLIAAHAPKEAVQKEQAKLKGTWTVVSAVRDGQPADDMKGDVVTFDGHKVTHKTKNEEHHGTYKIDPTQKPKTITLTPGDGAEKDKALSGIYSLEGDTLKVCAGQPGTETRPKALESKPGSMVTLVTLKREKEKK